MYACASSHREPPLPGDRQYVHQIRAARSLRRRAPLPTKRRLLGGRRATAASFPSTSAAAAVRDDATVGDPLAAMAVGDDGPNPPCSHIRR